MNRNLVNPFAFMVNQTRNNMDIVLAFCNLIDKEKGKTY